VGLEPDEELEMRQAWWSLVAGLAFAGCGGADEAAPTVVDVRGDEYAFVMPDQIDGGVVAMRFTNTGEELHEYALARLDEGRTRADVDAFLADPGALEGGPPEWIEDVGGVPTLSQGEEVTIARELEPGTYALLCFVPAPDGRPHIAHGMVRTFEVGEGGAAELPDADAVIKATDDSFEIPELEAGEQTLELRNEAAVPREFYLYSPNPGVTLAEVEEWGEGGFEGEPLATFLGAMQSIPPGASVFLTVDLKAGERYVFFDEELAKTEFSVGLASASNRSRRRRRVRRLGLPRPRRRRP